MKISLLFALSLLALLFTGCDLFSSSDDDKASSGGTEIVSESPPEQQTTPDKVTAEEPAEPLPATVTLSAFSDFSCTDAWTGRDGALGLAANSGSGTCQTAFQGVSSKYRVRITVQTEFDGRPYYVLSVNGSTIDSGRYPLSSELACDCPLDDWRSVCPDKKVEIDAGEHHISKGDIIKFYGQEDWECTDHGAYAKWHEISFEPVK
jgi:hypothetical protein